MPGATPNRSYPFPLGGEPPAGHSNIQDLAMAIDADATNSFVKKADLRVGHASMSFSAAWPVPSKGAWHQLPFNTAGGLHPEWCNTTTGRIVVPVAGVYSLQYTGAVIAGAGVITFNVTTSNWGDGDELFMQDSGHHVDTGQAFYVSLSNLWECAAGEQIMTEVLIQQHTQANPVTWGTMIVAKVEG